MVNIKNGLIINKFGTKYWYKDNLLHQVDGPAAIHANGYKEWYLEGKLYRVDGPVIEYANGDKGWSLEDKYYRRYFGKIWHENCSQA